jgi:hypothetical protein
MFLSTLKKLFKSEKETIFKPSLPFDCVNVSKSDFISLGVRDDYCEAFIELKCLNPTRSQFYPISREKAVKMVALLSAYLANPPVQTPPFDVFYK